MATNLKDGLMWGLTPVLLSSQGVLIGKIGAVVAVYPAVWGLCQLAAGPLSDRWGRKWLIVGGMAVQAIGVGLFAAGGALWHWLAAAAVIGLGTAAVYPTPLAAISDVAEPEWRATGFGVYRLWRDAGYALTGAAVGPLADASGTRSAFAAVAGVVLISGVAVALLMRETRKQSRDRG